MATRIYRPWALLVPLAAMALLALTASPAEAATTFTVKTTGDGGDTRINGLCDASPEPGRQCTLRAAIQEANNAPGADTIAFAIRGTDAAKTISPTRRLPYITGSTTIDGYTQGTKTARTTDDAKPNDNALPGQGSDAIIRVRLDGTNAGAEANGLGVRAPDTTIRGLAITRFARNGVLVGGAGATGNKIEGNFIGTDASGTQDAGNAEDGVRISGAPANTVGGTEPAQSNVISGNGSDGVEVGGAGATGNAVHRNYVGTDASGNEDLGNSSDGVHINDASNNTVGGASIAHINLISGNDSDGVAVSGPGAVGNRVQRNTIGYFPFSSHEDLVNAGAGVRLTGGAHDNLIGGLPTSTTFPGNTIAFNGEDGILVDAASTSNSLLSNETYSNGGLGIDLSGGTEDTFGVTANDVDPVGATDDADEGANELQNFPVIVSAAQENPDLFCSTIEVELNSTPDQTFTIQFFKVVDVDPSFHGEGVSYAGHTTTTTDADGDGSFRSINCAIAGDEMITATATNTATGDTSESSRNFIVSPPG